MKFWKFEYTEQNNNLWLGQGTQKYATNEFWCQYMAPIKYEKAHNLIIIIA